MVTNAVNMDVKVSAQNGTKQRDGDSGFSDVLGSVGSGERKQPGLSNSGRKEFGKEFGFTQRASETVRAPKDGSTEIPDADTSFAQQTGQYDAAGAEKALEQAAEIVTRTVAETGETLTKEQAAEMMTEALKTIAARNKTGGSPETEETSDDIADVLADIIAAIAGSETAEDVSADPLAPETEDGLPVEGPSVHVLTPDSSFLLTEKHIEAAMIAEGMEPEELTEGTGNGFADELGNMMGALGNEMDPEDAELLAFADEARQMFTGLTRYANNEFTDRSDLLAKVISKLDAEVVSEGGEPVSEMPAVQDAAKMLSEIIETARKELGLTETKLEQYTGERDAAVPLMQSNEPARLSHDMNRSDRTDELDHILNGGANTRADAPKQGEAPGTETYDAVRMASELMGDRTRTDIPLERTEFTEEAAAEVRPPEIQTAEQILDRISTMHDDHTEFTMVLNPESLGRITVKLVMVGERTAVEITAENPQTRDILAARSANVQSMLHENGVELERYQVVSGQEDAQFQRQSYDGSSKNPYSRNDEAEEKHDDDEDGESFYDLLGNL